MSTIVDHIIIAVRELDQASADFATMLGRAPSWQGTHPEYGSANTLFRLDNTYLELLTATGDGFAADLVTSHLADKGESIAAVVFGTPDATAFLDNARAHGLEVGDPQPGHGIDTASGAQRSWRNMFWPEEAARGLFGFCIEHDDADALPLAVPQGAGHCTAVDHVVLQTRSAEAAKQFYGAQLGIRLALEQSRPQWGGDMLFFRCNSMSIEVIATDKAPEQDNWWGLALKTDDIEACHARLTGQGVTVSDVRDGRKDGTKVMTVKSHCFDVPTLIIQHL